MAKETPGGTQFSFGFGGVDTKGYGELQVLSVGIWLPGICARKAKTAKCRRDGRERAREGNYHGSSKIKREQRIFATWNSGSVRWGLAVGFPDQLAYALVVKQCRYALGINEHSQ